MDIKSLNGAGGLPLGDAAGASSGTGQLSQQTFLKLLVTQMSNQDPLSPTDPTEFVSQLAQFTSLEQMVGVRESMELMLVSQTAATSAEVVSFVGREVRYDGDTFSWDPESGGETLEFSTARAAKSAELVVRDPSGKVVRTVQLGELSSGSQTWTFDGLDDLKSPVQGGTYTFEVTAEDANGEPVDVTTIAEGLVVGVTFEGGYPRLVLEGGQVVTLGQVLGVHDPDAPTPASPAEPPVEGDDPPAAPATATPSFHSRESTPLPTYDFRDGWRQPMFPDEPTPNT